MIKVARLYNGQPLLYYESINIEKATTAMTELRCTDTNLASSQGQILGYFAFAE